VESAPAVLWLARRHDSPVIRPTSYTNIS
jgi:hypothetical protein